jgi:hypothetical protein
MERIKYYFDEHAPQAVVDGLQQGCCFQERWLVAPAESEYAAA